MITRAAALVIGQVPYGDHDAVVHLLSRSEGRLAVFARGARRPRPRFGHALEPFSRVEAEWRQRGTGLASLLRADLEDGRPGLRGSLAALAVASCATETVRGTCPEGEPAPELYALLDRTLDLLAAGGASPALWAQLQLHLMSHAGYGVELDSCVACGAKPEPGRSVIVVPERGGVVCRACRRGHDDDGLLLRGDAVESLRALHRVPFAAPTLPALPPRGLPAIRRLLAELAEHAMGHPLRSLELLPYGQPGVR